MPPPYLFSRSFLSLIGFASSLYLRQFNSALSSAFAAAFCTHFTLRYFGLSWRALPPGTGVLNGGHDLLDPLKVENCRDGTLTVGSRFGHQGFCIEQLSDQLNRVPRVKGSLVIRRGTPCVLPCL